MSKLIEAVKKNQMALSAGGIMVGAVILYTIAITQTVENKFLKKRIEELESKNVKTD